MNITALCDAEKIMAGVFLSHRSHYHTEVVVLRL